MTYVDWGCNEQFWCLEGHSMCMPQGMQPWWLTGRQDHEESHIEHIEPEMSRVMAAEYPYRVLEGQSAMRIFSRNNTHHAGIRVRLPAVVGQVYRFEAHVQIWTAEVIEGNPPISSGDPHGFGVRIGIDPWGRMVPQGEGVGWSDWKGQEAWDTYVPMEVSAVAQASYITFYTLSYCKWQSRYNESYWDKMSATGQIPDPPPQGEWVSKQQYRQLLTTLRDQFDQMAAEMATLLEEA